MSEETFETLIVSDVDRENLIAELFYKNEQWAELSKEGEEVMVYFYSHPTKDYWEFPFDLAMEQLNSARERYKKFI